MASDTDKARYAMQTGTCTKDAGLRVSATERAHTASRRLEIGTQASGTKISATARGLKSIKRSVRGMKGHGSMICLAGRMLNGHVKSGAVSSVTSMKVGFCLD